MAAADFCTVTAHIAADRAARLVDVAASFFDTQRAARHCARYLVSRCEPVRVMSSSSRTARGAVPCRPRRASRPVSSPVTNSPQDCLCTGSAPGKDTNFPCTNAAFTLSIEPVGFAVMCQLASTLWALNRRFLSVVSHVCIRASSRPTLAGQPLRNRRQTIPDTPSASG